MSATPASSLTSMSAPYGSVSVFLGRPPLLSNAQPEKTPLEFDPLKDGVFIKVYASSSVILSRVFESLFSGSATRLIIAALSLHLISESGLN